MATNGSSPYSPPRADIADGIGGDYGEVPFFGVSGRIGRLRYLAYGLIVSVGMLFAMGILMVMLGGFTALMGRNQAGGPAALMGLVVVAFYVLMFVYHVTLTIRRAHDFDVSGWLSLLLLVPLANLIFLFIPGTRGENNYGPRPKPNSLWVLLVTLSLVIVPVGVVAAIAIPAYQHYVQRAKDVERAQRLIEEQQSAARAAEEAAEQSSEQAPAQGAEQAR